MWADRIQVFLYSPITWGVITFILTALATSGRLNMSLSNIMLGIAFIIGCFGIYRTGFSIHLIIIFCSLLGIILTGISWWIQPTPKERKPKQSHVELTIQVMPEPSKPPLQEHHIFITNRTFQPIFDCRIEIIFKDTVTKVEAWPVLKDRPGRIEFHGKNKDGSPFFYKDKIQMPNECSLNIHQVEVNNQVVNTNVLIFICQRWPRNVFAFSADIQTDSSKVVYPKRGPEQTYQGIYSYEVDGQTLSGTISGEFTKSEGKKTNKQD